MSLPNTHYYLNASFRLSFFDEMTQPEPAFLMECIFKLHDRICALETAICALSQHRHDDFGRVFASDGVSCRYLGATPMYPASLSAQPERSVGLDLDQSVSLRSQ